MADSDGETRRQRNIRFGQGHLNPVNEISASGTYLMNVYWELNDFKPSGFSGPEPLQPRTITDWMVLFKTPLSIDEVKIIMKMDKEFNRTYHKETESNKEKYKEGKSS